MDEDFNRSPERIRPLDTAPFYAVEIVLAIVAHTGGGKRNSKSQVINIYGIPIPRLYEMGSMISNIYQTSSFLTDCMIPGKIAGRETTQLSSWE